MLIWKENNLIPRCQFLRFHLVRIDKHDGYSALLE